MEQPLSFCLDKCYWMTEKHILLAVIFIVNVMIAEIVYIKKKT